MYSLINTDTGKQILKSNSRDYAIIAAMNHSKENKTVSVKAPDGSEVIRFSQGVQVNSSN